jgi:predicted negative regulator of RcsB-dependent stress response
MDSKHRHELQENVLASWLQDKLDSTQAQLPVIAAGVVAAIVAYAGWSLLAQTRESGRAAAWENYTLAIETGTPSLEMLDLAADDPNPDVANLARITWADGQLQQGSAKYFFDRAGANQALDKAQEAYDKLLKSSDPVMVNRARFGIARIQEIRGEVDAALKSYEGVTGSLGELAKERIEVLKSDTAKADYAWLATAERIGPASTSDPTQRPAAMPDNITLPDAEASREETLDDILSSAGLNDEANAAESAPGAESEKPATPAESETPATP